MARIKVPSELAEFLTRLTREQLRLFACDCAEHVLPFFEGYYPHDHRPRMAIQTGRQYAKGQATLEELREAAGAAEGAAWDSTLDEPDTDSAFDVAPSAAATAELCCLKNPEDVAEAAITTAIEVVVIAAVGLEIASHIWSEHWDVTDDAVLQRYRQVEAQERSWQLEHAKKYSERVTGRPAVL